MKKGTPENSGRPRATSAKSTFSGIKVMLETAAGHPPASNRSNHGPNDRIDCAEIIPPNTPNPNPNGMLMQ